MAGFPRAALRAQEDTYAISLVKTAVVDKDVYAIDGKKVRTETYTIQKGDYLWKIFRKRKLFEIFEADELLHIFKKLNSNLRDPNLIYPGQKIVFPLQFASSAVETDQKTNQPVKQPQPEELQKARYKLYTIKPGDSLSYVAMKRFNIPHKYLSRYLTALAEYNPEIKDINRVFPGMVVKMPVYYPDKGFLAGAEAETGAGQKKIEVLPPVKAAMGEALKIIFNRLGEEWRQRGQHYIPLQSGGQVNLRAESFPIILLRNGRRIIIDVHNKLPGNMTELIESSWKNYRVVHLDDQDELRTALSRILPVCGYAKLFDSEQPLELGGDIGLRIRGDWIVIPSRAENGSPRGVFVLRLRQKEHSVIPTTIKSYLDVLDIKVIEYPPVASRADKQEIAAPSSPQDLFAVIERLLELLQLPPSKMVRIPIYDSRETDYNLVIEADFFLKLNEKDAIINLSGLDRKVIDFLRAHRFKVLTLADEKEPLELMKKTLQFLDKDFVAGPHTLRALPKDEAGNIEMKIDGLIFSDHKGKSVFVSPRRLPKEIAAFLAGNDYTVICLPAY